MVGNVRFSLGGDARFRDLRKFPKFFVLFLNAVKILFLLTQMRSFALGLPEGDFSR